MTFVTMFVLYYDPYDHPKKWVLRRWTIKYEGPVPDALPIAVEDTREAAVKKLPLSRTLYPLNRDPRDEAQIMSIWF